MDPLDKNTLRVRCLGARKSIPPEQAAASAKALASHLLPQIPPLARIVAGYCAIHNEIDVRPAMDALYARGVGLCLPIVVGEGRPLIFRRWQPGDPLEKGAYGIDVPLPSAPELIPDAVIVPLAGFDARGFRLGYGAGYYDRSIPLMRARNSALQLIGAAYSVQQVERIPDGEHDQRMDKIVTEQGVLIPASQAAPA